MANRVAMGSARGAFGLYISKPGFDVTTCAASDLTFDSGLGHMGSVIISGTATVGQTIYFPAMSYVPLAHSYAYGGGVYRGFARFGRSDATGSNTGHVSTNRTTLVGSYRIFKNRIEFLGSDYPAAGSQNPGALSIRYVVWRIPGGV